MTTRERELIAWLLGDAEPSAATTRWLATPAGRDAAVRHRRTIERLDAWGRAAGAAQADRRRRAEPERILYYDRIATPLGAVFAAVGDRGLVRVSFEANEPRFVRDLARRHDAPVVRSTRQLAALRRALGRYGRGTRIDVPVDLAGVSLFQRRVLSAARRIPAGRVVSYGELARRIGQPRACRAVGQALGRNPVPLVIPCHRIVAGAGRLGGYVGGLARKRKLLALEGALRLAG